MQIIIFRQIARHNKKKLNILHKIQRNKKNEINTKPYSLNYTTFGFCLHSTADTKASFFLWPISRCFLWCVVWSSCIIWIFFLAFPCHISYSIQFFFSLKWRYGCAVRLCWHKQRNVSHVDNQHHIFLLAKAKQTQLFWISSSKVLQP